MLVYQRVLSQPKHVPISCRWRRKAKVQRVAERQREIRSGGQRWPEPSNSPGKLWGTDPADGNLEEKVYDISECWLSGFCFAKQRKRTKPCGAPWGCFGGGLSPTGTSFDALLSVSSKRFQLQQFHSIPQVVRGFWRRCWCRELRFLVDDAVVAVDVSIPLHQAVLIFRGDPNQEPFKRVFEAGKTARSNYIGHSWCGELDLVVDIRRTLGLSLVNCSTLY